MKCKKNIIKPSVEDCQCCDYFQACKLEQVRDSASSIHNIDSENTNNILDRIENIDRKGEENFGVFYVILRILIVSAIFATICITLGAIFG